MEKWNQQRREAAERYNRLFAGTDGVTTPHEPTWSRAVYHLYVIRTSDRDALQKYFGDMKIGTALHYPIPLHLQAAYVHLGYRKGDLPVSEQLTSEILSLPMFPGLRADQQEKVSSEFQQFRKAQTIGAGSR